MGEMVQFASNGATCSGYLARPEGGTGPGLVVIQEWWGLVGHITDVADRFAAEGFLALAPDLYHGTTTAEPDEAGKLMMAMDMARAARDLGGAVDYLAEAGSTEAVGVVGYCMGGGLALVLACQRPDRVKAVCPYYGLIPWPDAQPDWQALQAAVEGHYAENDSYFPPQAVAELETTLRDLGKDVQMFVYPDTDHAFFNDDRPEVYDEDAARLAFARTVAHLRAHLS